MIYAGIGSRELPADQCSKITQIAKDLDAKGYTLRSGGAKGADSAFALGSSKKQIWKANDATEASIKLASTLHPAWGACNEYARQLHGRNMMIILGKTLDAPVDFVLCWTLDEENGGTAMGLRLARQYSIEVINLQRQEFVAP